MQLDAKILISSVVILIGSQIECSIEVVVYKSDQPDTFVNLVYERKSYIFEEK